MNAEQLLEHYDRIADAPEAIPRLRRFILDLAVRGKLVPQDPNDEPASELLDRIAAEKELLVKARKIRKPKRLPAIQQDEPPFNLPRGWVWSHLLEISRKIHYGFTASANRAIDDVRLLRITDIQENKVEWSSVPGCEIAEKTLPQFKLEKGDVLIARTGGTIGKSFLVEDLPVIAVFASYLIRVQGSHEIYDRFLKLFLESPVYWAQLEDGARGAGQPNVNGQTLGNMLVSLPPTAEQHRIAAKVDELMALCDRMEAARGARETTRDRLAAASLARLNRPDPDPQTFRDHAAFALETLAPLTTRPDQIKGLRQTILDLAVRGYLVPQDPNDEPASELLKRIAVEKARLVKAGKVKKVTARSRNTTTEPDFPIPPSWVSVRLVDISNIVMGQSPPGETYNSHGEGVPLINGPVEFSEGPFGKTGVNQYTTASTNFCYEGDFLICVRGSTTGRSNVAAFRACIGRGVAAIQPLFDDAFVRLVVWNMRETIIEMGRGIAFPSISRKQLEDLFIPFPPLAEQRRIVAKVDELMALSDRLEASLTVTDATRRRLLDAMIHVALAPSDERETKHSSRIAAHG